MKLNHKITGKNALGLEFLNRKSQNGCYMATVLAPGLNFREISSIIWAYPTLYDLYEATYVICVTMVSQGNRCTIS